MENNKFFCYSKRMAHFIRSFDIQYINVGINRRTNIKYYVFEKSDKLDRVIELYNKVKHSI